MSIYCSPGWGNIYIIQPLDLKGPFGLLRDVKMSFFLERLMFGRCFRFRVWWCLLHPWFWNLGADKVWWVKETPLIYPVILASTPYTIFRRFIFLSFRTTFCYFPFHCAILIIDNPMLCFLHVFVSKKYKKYR